jgi:hypothetical protein
VEEVALTKASEEPAPTPVSQSNLPIAAEEAGSDEGGAAPVAPPLFRGSFSWPGNPVPKSSISTRSFKSRPREPRALLGG